MYADMEECRAITMGSAVCECGFRNEPAMIPWSLCGSMDPKINRSPAPP